jgi:hypothetical protein
MGGRGEGGDREGWEEEGKEGIEIERGCGAGERDQEKKREGTGVDGFERKKKRIDRVRK